MKSALAQVIKALPPLSSDDIVRSDNSPQESSFMEIKESTSRALGGDPVLMRGLNIQLIDDY